jgi:hypothetical protein
VSSVGLVNIIAGLEDMGIDGRSGGGRKTNSVLAMMLAATVAGVLEVARFGYGFRHSAKEAVDRWYLV